MSSAICSFSTVYCWRWQRVYKLRRKNGCGNESLHAHASCMCPGCLFAQSRRCSLPTARSLLVLQPGQAVSFCASPVGWPLAGRRQACGPQAWRQRLGRCHGPGPAGRAALHFQHADLTPLAGRCHVPCCSERSGRLAAAAAKVKAAATAQRRGFALHSKRSQRRQRARRAFSYIANSWAGSQQERVWAYKLVERLQKPKIRDAARLLQRMSKSLAGEQRGLLVCFSGAPSPKT